MSTICLNTEPQQSKHLLLVISSAVRPSRESLVGMKHQSIVNGAVVLNCFTAEQQICK